MSAEKYLFLMRNLYTGLQAEALGRYEKAGILEGVEVEKREQSLAGGKMYCEMLGVTQVKEAFLKPSEIVECARWELCEEERNLTAICKGCKIAAICKKTGITSPCNIYCLNPIEGMIKGLEPGAEFKVESTLMESDKCRVIVKW